MANGNELIIEKIKNENTLTISLNGRLDTITAPELEKTLLDCFGEVTELVFDLSGLVYVSSAGLRTLLTAQKAMNKRGKMKIINVCEDVYEIFEITGFTDIFTIE